MSFAKLQENLRAEGWFVEWNMPCCQTCAWAEVDHDNLEKVLFNHSQDCEIESEYEDCYYCNGEGGMWLEEGTEDEEWDDCPECGGSGEEYSSAPADADTSVSGFICNTPEMQDGSHFCYAGDKKGVENLKSILPIIEQSGCEYNWNGDGASRIYISW